jgi:hypothetical protein
VRIPPIGISAVTYRSEQFRIFPQNIKVLVENDWGMNDDEVYMKIRTDYANAPGEEACFWDPLAGIKLPAMDPSGDTAFHENDVFGIYDTDASLTTYTEDAYITFCESDGTAATNDFLGEVHVTTDVVDQAITKTMTVGDVISKYLFTYVVKRETPTAEAQQCP